MLSQFRHRLRLRSQRTSSLGDLGTSGQAKVRAAAGPATAILKSPITGRDCVFYHVYVSEWFNGSKTPLLEELSSAPFRMSNGTSSILVDPSRAERLLRARLVVGHSSDYLGQHRTLLRRHELGMVDEYGELRSLEFCETIVVPGDVITALGSIRMQSDPQGVASYREQPQTRVLGSDLALPLLLSDRL